MKGRLFLFLFGLILVMGLGLSRYALQVSGGKTQRELLSPPKDIIYFTAGHRDLLADLLWIRAIQDFDYCEKKINKQLCTNNSWLYQVLDVITDLSPQFRMAYSAGAMALTIVISDIEGASKFFDKAVAHFPKDWIILYHAAYHAIYEEKNNEKAAKLVEGAAQNGAPDWVYSLSARLYSSAGKKDLAQGLILQLESSGGDPRMIEKLKERMQAPDAGEVRLPSAATENGSEAR